MGWIIREYRPGDEEDICRLLNETIGGYTLDEWRWKYQGDYLPNRSWIDLGVDDDGSIVGHYPSLPRIMHIGEREYLMGMPCDIVVDINYRRGLKKRGMAQALFERQKELPLEVPERISLGFGCVTRVHYRIGKRLMNYRDLCKLDKLVYPVYNIPVFSPVLRLKYIRGLIRRLFAYPRLIRLKKKASSWNKQYDIRRIERFGPEIDRFYEKFSQLYPVGLRLDSRYLNGRFMERPSVDYSVFTCSVKGEVEGYVICRMRGNEGILADLVALDDPAVNRCLIDQAMRYFAEHGAGIALGLFLPGSFLYDQLVRYGFSMSGESTNIVYWIFFEEDLDKSVFTDMKNWHLTYGTFDDA